MYLAGEKGAKVPVKPQISVRENIKNFKFHEFASAADFTSKKNRSLRITSSEPEI
jgi:hypothetical protein